MLFQLEKPGFFCVSCLRHTLRIGRIRRYGQTKTVQVWRFIVDESIDSEILAQRGGIGVNGANFVPTSSAPAAANGK